MLAGLRPFPARLALALSRTAFATTNGTSRPGRTASCSPKSSTSTRKSNERNQILNGPSGLQVTRDKPISLKGNCPVRLDRPPERPTKSTKSYKEALLSNASPKARIALNRIIVAHNHTTQITPPKGLTPLDGINRTMSVTKNVITNTCSNSDYTSLVRLRTDHVPRYINPPE